MNLKNLLVKTKEPYPKIKDAINNPRTVCIIKNLMSGNEGELTAVLQYFYQSSISKDMEKEISDVLEEISIVEMMHLEMLSHAIVDFGGEPRYENGIGQSFNANTVNYSTKLSKILDANILGEEKAIENYKKAIDMVDNNSLKELFKRIIEDEKLHIKIFTHLRDSVRFMSI